MVCALYPLTALNPNRALVASSRVFASSRRNLPSTSGITTSAPSARNDSKTSSVAVSLDLGRHIAIVLIPLARASCNNARPTPEVAAFTTIVSPSRASLSTNSRSAVHGFTVIIAASCTGTSRSITSNAFAFATTSRRHVPSAYDRFGTTLSPVRAPLASALVPHAVTSPTISFPPHAGSSRATGYLPSIMFTSDGFTGAARTRTRTSSSPSSSGNGIDATRRTSPGAPRSAYTHASVCARRRAMTSRIARGARRRIARRARRDAASERAAANRSARASMRVDANGR